MNEAPIKLCPFPEGAAPESFEEPWMARAFALVTALSEAGVFSLADFQAQLIGVVREWEQDAPISQEIDYYTCWVSALSAILDERGLIAPGQLGDAERRVVSDALGRREHQHASARAEDGSLRVKPIVVD